MDGEQASEVTTFSADLEEMPIVIGTERFVLKEMNGKARDAYGKFVMSKTRYDAQGKPCGMSDVTDLHAELLSRTLYREGSSAPVDKTWANTLPAKTQSGLFKLAQKLSALDDNAEADAKKD